MSFNGLITYVSVLAAPRVAFDRLRQNPTWGWAAIGCLLLTLAAVLIAGPAQTHLLAVSEAHRIAALPPSERLQERIATAQVAGLRTFLFMIGALTLPWITWLLIALFLAIAAAIAGSSAPFRLAWAASLNSYIVYALGGVINACLVAMRDPATVNTPLDLVRVPSLGWLVHGAPATSAFLSAYNIVNVWYFVTVGLALHHVLRLRRVAAIVTAVAFSSLFGFFATLVARGGP